MPNPWPDCAMCTASYSEQVDLREQAANLADDADLAERTGDSFAAERYRADQAERIRQADIAFDECQRRAETGHIDCNQ